MASRVSSTPLQASTRSRLSQSALDNARITVVSPPCPESSRFLSKFQSIAVGSLDPHPGKDGDAMPSTQDLLQIGNCQSSGGTAAAEPAGVKLSMPGNWMMPAITNPIQNCRRYFT